MKLHGIEEPVKVSIAEIKLLRVIHDAARFSAVVFQPLVNDDSAPSYKKLLDSIYLLDRVNISLLESEKRIYRQLMNEKGVRLVEGADEMLYQKDLPIIDIGTGLLTDKSTTGKETKDKYTAPGGHAQWGVRLLFDALNFIVPNDNKTYIRAFYNGDGTANFLDETILGWMAKERVPIVMITTTKAGLDKKGGQIGIQRITLSDGSVVLRPQILELAQAKQVSKDHEKLFYAIGLSGLDTVEGTDVQGNPMTYTNEHNRQYFNTNIALFNYSVLTPILKALAALPGVEFAGEMLSGSDLVERLISPDLIENVKDKADGKKYTQLEGAIASTLLNLNAFFATTTDERVKAILSNHNVDKILRIVNVNTGNRTNFFTPVKNAFDFWFQAYSDYYTFDPDRWTLRDSRSGLELPTIELSSFYEDVQNTIDAFGAASTKNLKTLFIEGRVLLADAVLKGDVKIISQYPEIFDLNSASARIQLDQLDSGFAPLILEDTKIIIDAKGNVRTEPLNGASGSTGLTTSSPVAESEPLSSSSPVSVPDRVTFLPEQLAGFERAQLGKVNIYGKNNFVLAKPEAITQLKEDYQERLKQIISFVSHYINGPPLEVNMVIEPVQIGMPSLWYEPSSNTLHIQIILLTDLVPLEYAQFAGHYDFILYADKKSTGKEAMEDSRKLLNDKPKIKTVLVYTYLSKDIPIESLLEWKNLIADITYSEALHEKLNKLMKAAQEKAKESLLVIGENFWPSALLDAKGRKDSLGAVDYKNDIAGNVQYLAAAKEVHLVALPMDGGIGANVDRLEILKKKWRKLGRDGDVRMGAKGTDLFFEVDLYGYDKNGNRKLFKAQEISVTELKYLHLILTTPQFGKVTVRELVNDESREWILDFLYNKNKKRLYLKDRLNKRPEAKKRTYAKYLDEKGIDVAEEIVQSALPTIDLDTQKLTTKKTEPGGHGHLGQTVLTIVATQRVPKGETRIYAIYNGDGPNNYPNAYIAGWMAKEHAPIVMVTTTKMGLDIKGGIIGVEYLSGGKFRIQMCEEAQAKETDKTKPGNLQKFYDMGLTLGEAGQQYFNTNMALVNHTVLGPFLAELKAYMESKEYLNSQDNPITFSEIITPDLMGKDVEDASGKKFRKLEGALGSALLNLDAFVRNTDDARINELKKKHDIYKVVRIINVAPELRDTIFTPIKLAFDMWFYSKSDHFKLNTKNWTLTNLRPGHLPAVDEDFVRNNKYYQSVQKCIDAFGNASTIGLDEWSMNKEARVHLKDAILRGKVKIISECPEIIDLNEKEARKALGQETNKRLVLENIEIRISKEGEVLVYDLSASSPITVTIDGPSGSGKGNVAKLLAEKLGFLYVDGGSIFRAVTLKAIRQKADVNDANILKNLVDRTKIGFDKTAQGALLVLLDGEDVSKEIRSPEVVSKVSRVAAHRHVAETLFRLFPPSALLEKISEVVSLYKDNPEEWRGIMMRGMQQNFSWDASVRKYLALYEEAIKKSAGSSSPVSSPVHKTPVYPYQFPVAPDKQAEYTQGLYAKAKVSLTGDRAALDILEGVLPSPYQAELEAKLNELMGLIKGFRQQAPPQNLTFIVTTDLAKTDGYVATSDILSKTVFIHPFIFSLPSTKQLEILYHEIFSHITKETSDEIDATRHTNAFLWLRDNGRQLIGKTLVTLCVEGNIPELEGYDAQNANTMGGLGAYYGDKLEGLYDVGIKAYGVQPMYSKVLKNGQFVDVDYDELIAKGVIQRVHEQSGKPLILQVFAWDDYDHNNHSNNALIDIEVYRINRGGTWTYLLRNLHVFDVLYTDYRVHRFTQEIVYGKATYQLLKKLNIIPDILHLNEAHTVVAAALMRADEAFKNMVIVYTNHTIVPAGLEMFNAGDMRTDTDRMMYQLGIPEGSHVEFRSKFMRPNGVVDFCYAASHLADVINAVTDEHAVATEKLFKAMYGHDFKVSVIGVLNGSGKSWKNGRLRVMENEGVVPSQEELWNIHEDAKVVAFKEIEARTGIALDSQKPTFWMVRRITDYKSQYPMLRFLVHLYCADRGRAFTRDELRGLWYRDMPDLSHDFNQGMVEKVLNYLFEGRENIYGLGAQVVVGGPEYKKWWIEQFKNWAQMPEFKGRFVYVPNSDVKLLKMQAIGADICINMPRPLEEACGTSDQRTGLNGGINIAIRGAGPVEWITDYNETTGEGNGLLIDSYTRLAADGTIIADHELFYSKAPVDIFKKSELAVKLFYEQRDTWTRLMLASYLASAKVTALAMELRYVQKVYVAGLELRKSAGQCASSPVNASEQLKEDIHDIKNKFIVLGGFASRIARKTTHLTPYLLERLIDIIKALEKNLSDSLKGKISETVVVEYLRDNAGTLLVLKDALRQWFKDKGIEDDYQTEISFIFTGIDKSVARIKGLSYIWLAYSMRYASIREMAANVIEILDKSYPETRLMLEIDDRVPEEPVFTYEDFLVHSWHELIYNAYKYGDKTRIKLMLKVAAGNELESRVTNSGKVLTQKMQAKMFEPGVRGEDAAEIEGTGFGLASLKNDVESLGGKISTHSDYISGTTVAFTLPMNAPKNILPIISFNVPHSIMIALSGLAGSGRRTVGRALAGRLGFRYINPRFLMRVLFTYFLKERPGVSLEDEHAITAYLIEFFEKGRIDFTKEPLRIDGINTLAINSEGISLRTRIKREVDASKDATLLFHRFVHLPATKAVVDYYFNDLLKELKGSALYSGIIVLDTDPWANADLNIMLLAPSSVRADRLKKSAGSIDELDEKTSRVDFGPHLFAGLEIYSIRTDDKTVRDVVNKAFEIVKEHFSSSPVSQKKQTTDDRGQRTEEKRLRIVIRGYVESAFGHRLSDIGHNRLMAYGMWFKAGFDTTEEGIQAKQGFVFPRGPAVNKGFGNSLVARLLAVGSRLGSLATYSASLLSRVVYLSKIFRQFAAVKTLKGRSSWRDRKYLFSVTRISALTYSAYAAINASADLRPLDSYFEPNSNGTSVSSSIFVKVFIKSINSLKASGVRLWRTSLTIRRGMRTDVSLGVLKILLRSFSDILSPRALRAKMYSLLSRMSSKFFLPELFPGFANLVNGFLFGHSAIGRAGLRHDLANFFKPPFGYLDTFFHNLSHLSNRKHTIVLPQSQANNITTSGINRTLPWLVADTGSNALWNHEGVVMNSIGAAGSPVNIDRHQVTGQQSTVTKNGGVKWLGRVLASLSPRQTARYSGQPSTQTATSVLLTLSAQTAMYQPAKRIPGTNYRMKRHLLSGLWQGNLTALRRIISQSRRSFERGISSPITRRDALRRFGEDRRRLLKLLMLTPLTGSLMALLNACGGGGGSQTTTPVEPPVEPPAPPIAPELAWIKGQINPSTYLVESYQGLPSTDYSYHKSFIYDQAMAILALLRFGGKEEVELAGKMVDAMLSLQLPEGGWYEAYDVAAYQIGASFILVGPISLLGLSLLAYAHTAGVPKDKSDEIIEALYKAADYLITFQIPGGASWPNYGSLSGGILNDGTHARWTSTEHNADTLAFFYALGYSAQAKLIADWLIREMWNGTYFETGYSEGTIKDTVNGEKLDAQAWTLLSLDATRSLAGINPQNYVSALNYIAVFEKTANRDGALIKGFSKNIYAVDSVWVEGMSSYILARHILADEAAYATYMPELEKMKIGDHGLLFAVGLPTRGWPENFRYAHAASTAWALFAKNKANPFDLASSPLSLQHDYIKKGEVRAIIFDYDGTIVNTIAILQTTLIPILVEIYKEVYAGLLTESKLRELRGLAEITVKEKLGSPTKEMLPGMIADIVESVGKEGKLKPFTSERELYEKYYSRYRDERDAAILQTPNEYLLTPEVKDVIKRLAAAFPLAIVSATTEKKLVILKNAGLAEEFRYIKFSENDAKGKIRALIETIKDLNVKREEVVFVDDSSYFIRELLRYPELRGLRIIWKNNNPVNTNENRNWPQEYTIERLRDLLVYLPGPSSSPNSLEFGEASPKAGSPIEAKSLSDIIKNPSGEYSLPIDPGIIQRYRAQINWFMDRLKKSTAGVRGTTMALMDSEWKKDLSNKEPAQRIAYLNERWEKVKAGEEESQQLHPFIVALFAQAYVNYIKKNISAEKHGMFIGYDERFFSLEYADIVTRVLVGNGLRVMRDADGSTPTPVSSYIGYYSGLAGSMEITSSHNPPYQNGMKSATYYGGVDTDDISDMIAKEVDRLYNYGQGSGEIRFGSLADEKLISSVDAKMIFFDNYVRRLYPPQAIEMIKQAMDQGARFIFDGICGVGGKTMRYYLERLFGDYPWQDKIIVINDQPDPTMKGIVKPDPSIVDTLKYTGALDKLAENPEVLISVTADMDADRIGTAVIIPASDIAKAKKFGLVVKEEKGVSIVCFTPNQIFTLIGYERMLQVKNRIAQGALNPEDLHLMTSIPSSKIAKAMIESVGGTPHLLAVGFKNLGQEAFKTEANERAVILILMEESGGGQIGLVGERDSRGSGIHKDKDTCVLALALYALTSKLFLNARKNLVDFYIKMAENLGGLFYYERVDVELSDDKAGEERKEFIKGRAEGLEDIANKGLLAGLFDKENIIEEKEIAIPHTLLLQKDSKGLWATVQPRGMSYGFEDGEVLEIFHAGEGPMISLYDKKGILKGWALIRPSGTENTVRVYLEVFEDFREPRPEHLYSYFEKLMVYLGLDNPPKAGELDYITKLKKTATDKYASSSPVLAFGLPQMLHFESDSKCNNFFGGEKKALSVRSSSPLESKYNTQGSRRNYYELIRNISLALGPLGFFAAMALVIFSGKKAFRNSIPDILLVLPLFVGMVGVLFYLFAPILRIIYRLFLKGFMGSVTYVLRPDHKTGIRQDEQTVKSSSRPTISSSPIDGSQPGIFRKTVLNDENIAAMLQKAAKFMNHTEEFALWLGAWQKKHTVYTAMEQKDLPPLWEDIRKYGSLRVHGRMSPKGELLIGERLWYVSRYYRGAQFELDLVHGVPLEIYFLRDKSRKTFLPVIDNSTGKIIEMHSDTIKREKLTRYKSAVILRQLDSSAGLSIGGKSPYIDGTVSKDQRRHKTWAIFDKAYAKETGLVQVKEGIVHRFMSLESALDERFALSFNKVIGKYVSSFWGSLYRSEFNLLNENYELHGIQLQRSVLELAGEEWMRFDLPASINDRRVNVLEIKRNERKKAFVAGAEVIEEGEVVAAKSLHLIHQPPLNTREESFLKGELFNSFERWHKNRIIDEAGIRLATYIVSRLNTDETGELTMDDHWGTFKYFPKALVEAKVINNKKRFIKFIQDKNGLPILDIYGQP
ncbi:MAG: (d)CMP kinase, partial [Candidatus Omnitrophota bacterium]